MADGPARPARTAGCSPATGTTLAGHPLACATQKRLGRLRAPAHSAVQVFDFLPEF